MAKKKLNILLIFDIGEVSVDQDWTDELKSKDWKFESNLVKTLEKLGHSVKLFGIDNNVIELVDELKENRPDLVFNQCEAYGGQRALEPNLMALMELFDIPYTGARAGALRLCQDKGITKKILAYHRVRVPYFLTFKKKQPLKSLKEFKFPAIIKPLGLEASEGISQTSFVEDEESALERVKWIHESLDVDAIVEEFIDGRELYVGVYGNDRQTKVLPPRELFFMQVPEGTPKFATYRAKWDTKYRKKWGIQNRPANKIDEEVLKQINRVCKRIYQIFGLSGYARIDLRLSTTNEVVFIEANPNPALGKDEDFMKSADKSGMSFDDMIAKIIQMSL